MFGATTSANNLYTPISDNTGYNGAISGFGVDLSDNNTRDIIYTTTGAAPNRVFTVQWREARRFAEGGNLDFQIKLFETSNRIDIVYANFGLNNNNINVQVGLRGANNTDFNNRSLTTTNTSWDNNTTAGGANNSACRSRNNNQPTNGRTFTWTPPTPPTITSLGAASGCVGSSLVINGTNLLSTTAVTIGGTAATITGTTAITVTVTVGAGTTGTVQVTTPGGTATSAATFTVNPLPANPGNPTSNSLQCNPPGVTLMSSGTPPAGVTWYWQGTNPAGTSTANSAATFVATTSGTYYLRAQNNTTGCWSAGSGSLAVVITPTLSAIAGTPAPTNAATGICYAGGTPLTDLTWSAVAGAASYDVYFGAGSLPGTAIANVATNSYSLGTLSASTTYYWQVVPRNACGATTGTPATWTFTTTVAPCVCVPTSTNNTYPISNVTFAGINNNSSALVTAGPDYQDFSSIIGNVTAGSTYNISVTSTGVSPNTFYQYVYFDWNNNGDFTDDGGAFTIGTYTTNTATLNTNILIPVTATIGTIRMRVGNSFNAIYDPCITAGGNFQFEDYSITIAAPPVCGEPTGQPTTLVLTPGATSINGSFTAAAPVPQNYFVVMNTTGIAPTGLIMDGTTYPIGSSVGVGNTVVDTDSNLTFTAGGLNTTSTYYFFIYSMNALCSGGPLYNTNAVVLIGNATTVGAPTAPCVPQTNTAVNQDMYISRVAFIGTLVETNNNSTSSEATPGYQDFTGLAIKAQQAQGEGVNMIVESTGGRTKLYAWVDWNKNGTFEDSEKIYGPPSAGISSTFGFIIPSGTVPGNYRIRVRTYNSFYVSGPPFVTNETFGYNFNACETFNTIPVGPYTATQYGEAEDYLFTVIQRCAANITSVTDGSVCGSGVPDLVATGTTGTTEIRWYTALTGGTLVGTSASGAIFDTSPSISTTTTYYCTAWNLTCESLERTPVIARVDPIPTLTFTQSAPDVCGEGAIVALTAGGDKQLTNLFYERFEGGGLGGFTNVNTDATPIGIENDAKWTNRASTFVPTTGLSWKPAISSGLAPNHFALATSDSGTPPDQLVENSITSGILNSTSYLNLTMTMKFYYSRYFPDNTNNADEFVTIDISTNGGGAWTPLQTFTADTGIGTKFVNLSYNLNAYINQTNLRIRVRHHSLGSVTGYLPDGVAIDDVRIFGDLPLNTAFVWSGASLPDVYSNPAATTPYVAGSPVVNVYVKPTLAQLEMGSYTFTATAVLSNGCSVSQDITILNKSKVWKGAVDNDWYNANNWNPIGVPDANSCVIIPAITTTANRPSEINTVASSAFGKSLNVKNNGVLKLYASNNLTIGNGIIVEPTGLIDMENSSNLVQIANVANTGNISMKRTTSIRKQDYVYWSSPVANFASNAISPGTSLGYQYKWTPTIATNFNFFGNWAAANETMVLGKGYIIRGPNAYSNAALANYTATFVGVPNNGNISIPISRGIYDGVNYSTGVSTTPGTKDDDNWNLVGNPYPSAIDAKKFLTLNTNIAGFVNIWTHGTLPSSAIIDPFYNNYTYNYTPTDYITYNLTGASTQSGFNGLIGAGQGFFVSMLHASAAATENLIFNNDLRRDVPTGNTYNNTQFFRTADASASATKESEKHRIWFDLVTPSGVSSRGLLGYVEDATNQHDRLYDAFSNEKLSFNIFSLIDEERMLIQGRKLPFDVNDKVNIGLSIPQDGLYKIALGSVDGLFTDSKQNIYVEDKLLNIIFNLKDAPYSFMGNKGTTLDRFVLRYTKTDAVKELSNQVTVYDNTVLTVESGKLKIKDIVIYDTLGKLILNKNNVNTLNYPITNLNKTNSMLIVKVTLEDNTEEVRKVIY